MVNSRYPVRTNLWPLKQGVTVKTEVASNFPRYSTEIKKQKRVRVRFIVQYLVVPLPQGRECTHDYGKLWDFVFGPNASQHASLNGLEFECQQILNGESDDWTGCWFILQTDDPQRYEQIDVAAKAVKDYLEERWDVIEAGLERCKQRSDLLHLQEPFLRRFTAKKPADAFNYPLKSENPAEFPRQTF